MQHLGAGVLPLAARKDRTAVQLFFRYDSKTKVIVFARVPTTLTAGIGVSIRAGICTSGGKEVRFPCSKSPEAIMLAKLTSKNQITLPKAVVSEVDAAEYFEVAVENGRIVLTPVRVQRAQAVRDKLQRLGITEQDVEDAIAWARR